MVRAGEGAAEEDALCENCLTLLFIFVSVVFVFVCTYSKERRNIDSFAFVLICRSTIRRCPLRMERKLLKVLTTQCR